MFVITLHYHSAAFQQTHCDIYTVKTTHECLNFNLIHDITVCVNYLIKNNTTVVYIPILNKFPARFDL